MKSEAYRRAFDNLRVPDEMAERICRAAASGEGSRANASRRRISGRAQRGAAAGACAAALAVLLFQTGLLPRRTEFTSAACLDSGVYLSRDDGASGSEAPPASADKTGGGTAGSAPEDAEKAAPSGGKAAAPSRAAGDSRAKKAPSRAAVSHPEDGTQGKLPQKTPEGSDPALSIQTGNPVETAESPADLAGMLGFAPSLPAAVPEGWQVLSCAAIGGSTAQIVYADSRGGQVCWRTAPGGGDPSGVTPDGPGTDAGDGVTTRGEDGRTQTAWWTEDGMAFSLTFFPAASAEDTLAWVAAVRG